MTGDTHAFIRVGMIFINQCAKSNGGGVLEGPPQRRLILTTIIVKDLIIDGLPFSIDDREYLIEAYHECCDIQSISQCDMTHW